MQCMLLIIEYLFLLIGYDERLPPNASSTAREPSTPAALDSSPVLCGESGAPSGEASLDSFPTTIMLPQLLS